MAASMMCPYCGEVHRLDVLLEQPFHSVASALIDGGDQLYSRRGRGPEVSHDELLDEAISSIRSTESPWIGLPCATGPHLVPSEYVQERERGRASVICPGRPPRRRKDVMLAGLGVVIATNALASVGVHCETRQVAGHWRIFREFYVESLLQDAPGLMPTYVTQSGHVNSLWFRMGVEGGRKEWIVVVDTAGESSVSSEIFGRGGHLRAADTVVLLVDGQAVVRRLRAPAEPCGGGWRIPAIRGGCGVGSEYEVNQARFLSGVLDYLVSPEVQEVRVAHGRGRLPNGILAVSKGDLLLNLMESRVCGEVQN